MIVYLCAITWIVWWSGWLLVGMASRRNVEREPLASRLPHLIPLAAGNCCVFSPVVFGVYFPLHWSYAHRCPAIGLMLVGLLLAAWAREHLGRNWSGLVAIKSDHQLITTGPYRFMRHPIYTGLLIAITGTALAVNTYGALLGPPLWLVAFSIKAAHEEKLLRKHFGLDYTRHCQAVPCRLIPGMY